MVEGGWKGGRGAGGMEGRQESKPKGEKKWDQKKLHQPRLCLPPLRTIVDGGGERGTGRGGAGEREVREEKGKKKLDVPRLSLQPLRWNASFRPEWTGQEPVHPLLEAVQPLVCFPLSGCFPLS